jgi:hypothetical protein
MIAVLSRAEQAALLKSALVEESLTASVHDGKCGSANTGVGWSAVTLW